MSYADITRAVGAEHVRDLRREAGEALRASQARRRAVATVPARRAPATCPQPAAACAC